MLDPMRSTAVFWTALSLLLVVSRTAEGQYTGPINVKLAPFSAVGNGIADDTAAFNAAVAALPATGGQIYIPAGTYRLTNSVVVNNKSVSFRGDGQRISVLDFQGVGGTGHGIQFTAATSCPQGNCQTNTLQVQSLSLFRSVNSPPVGAAIYASWPTLATHLDNGVETVTIRDVHIVSQRYQDNAGPAWLYGVLLNNATAARIESFNMVGASTGVGVGVAITGKSLSVTIAHGDMSKFATAIDVSGTSEGIHIDGVETSETNYGVKMTSGPGTVITNSHFNALAVGIALHDSGGVAVTNNLIFNGNDNNPAYFAGIEVSSLGGTLGGGAGAFNGVRLIGNHIASAYANSGNSAGIVLINNAADTVIQGNSTFHTKWGIILMGSNVTRNVVTGNRIMPLTPSGGGAIVELSGSTGNLIVNNLQ